MLTVLLKETETRRETTYPADSVTWTPPGDGPKYNPDAGLLIECAGNLKCDARHFSPTPEGKGHRMEAFVMNDQGKTISRYYL